MRKLTLIIFILCTLCASSSALAADSYGDYPTPDEMFAQIYELRDAFPDFVRIGEYGRSVEGRPLLYVRIARPGAEGLSQAMIAANIHGNEWIGNRVAMGAARRLLEGKNSDPWISSLLDNIEFYVLPCLNPDGYHRTWVSRDKPEVKWKVSRRNARGVDLNRNFPLPGKRTVDDAMAGSEDPESARYVGPYPYSEPESKAIHDFVSGKKFFASIDLHSHWGTFFPPKCNGSACERQFKKMMAAASEKQVYSKYPTVAAWRVDSFSGEMEDELFYKFGVMAVCWEVFPTSFAMEQKKRHKLSFWGGNPEDVDHWVENDQDAVLAALGKAYEITAGKPVIENYRKVRQ